MMRPRPPTNPSQDDELSRYAGFNGNLTGFGSPHSAGRPVRAADRQAEAGTATVEMAVLGSLVFGVLVHAIVLFGVIQRSMLAASAAAREVGRVVVLADTEPEASQRAEQVLTQVATNHGLAVSDFDVALEGTVARGEKLRVTVRTSAPVASLPFIGSVWPTLSVPIEAVYVGRVDKFRSFDR